MRTLITWLVIAIVLWASRANSGERPTPPRGFSYEDLLPGAANLPRSLPAGPAASHPAQSAGQDSTANAAPTPYSEVVRVLALLPKPDVGFVDFGCGPRASVCIAAAEQWRDSRVIGVEINPSHAASARKAVHDAGFSDRIEIIEGDATKVDIKADVAFVYLYHSLLESLAPRLQKMKAVASYKHHIPGLPVMQNGATWFYLNQTQQTVSSRPFAVWKGLVYYGRECVDPTCGMCWEIQRQIASKMASQSKAIPLKSAVQSPQPTKVTGHWEDRTVCTFNSRGRKTGCSIQSVWVE